MKRTLTFISFRYIIVALCIMNLGVSLQAQQAITYSLVNAHITSDGTDYFYEADVSFVSNTDFTLGMGQFFFDYNTLAFGENIVASGHFIINHPVYTASSYKLDENIPGFNINKYQPPIVNDSFNNKFGIAWVQNLGASNIALSTADVPQLLLHVKIKFIDVTQDPGFAFDNYTPEYQNLTFNAVENPSTEVAILIEDTTYNSTEGAISNANVWLVDAATNAWEDASNWSLGVLPTFTHNVSIPYGSVVLNSEADAASVTIEAQGSLDISSTSSLTVLNINVPVTTSGNEALTIQSGGCLLVGTSSVGTMKYVRSLQNTHWHLIASPFQNQPVLGFANLAFMATNGQGGGDPRGDKIALAHFDNTQNNSSAWQYYMGYEVIDDGAGDIDNTADMLTSGKGYSVMYSTPGDLIFSGTFPSGNGEIPLVNGLPTGSLFNLIGNPFPSYFKGTKSDPADIANLLTQNTSVLSEETLWLWDGTLNGGAGDYVAVNHVQTQYIAPAQGFFVKAAEGGGTFVFDKTFQDIVPDTFVKEVPSSSVKITLQEGKSEKHTSIYFADHATLGFDNGYDSSVYEVEDSFSIYTRLPGDENHQKLAIQSLPKPSTDALVIPLGIHAKGKEPLTIKPSFNAIPETLVMYLEDRYLHTMTKLSDNKEVVISLEESTKENPRWYLHIQNKDVINDFNPVEDVSLFMSGKRRLTILSNTNLPTELRVYSILGKPVFQTSLQKLATQEIVLPPLASGVYIVETLQLQGRTNKKIILE